MAPILSAIGLTKRYRLGQSEVEALRGVTIDIDAGAFVQIRYVLMMAIASR